MHSPRNMPPHAGPGGQAAASQPVTPLPVAPGQGQLANVAGPPQVSLAVLVEFIVQRTYHDLTVLAELLPRKTDMERKIEIFNFASRTRMVMIRLLALVKWASSASKVDKCASIMAFCERSANIFMDTADSMARMARETLVRATLPNFHLPAAVEILTTGNYNRCVVLQLPYRSFTQCWFTFTGFLAASAIASCLRSPSRWPRGANCCSNSIR